MTPLVPPLPPPLGGDSSDKSAPRRQRIPPNKKQELGMERPIRSFTPAPCQCLISTLIFPNVNIAVERKSQAAPGCWELPTTRAGFQLVPRRAVRARWGVKIYYMKVQPPGKSPGEQARDRHGKCSHRGEEPKATEERECGTGSLDGSE